MTRPDLKTATAREILRAFMPRHEEQGHSLEKFDQMAESSGVFRVVCSCRDSDVFLDAEVRELVGEPKLVAGRLAKLGREWRGA